MNRLVLPFVLLAAACGPKFEKQSHVSKLRVLAVRADPPEVVLVPGQPMPPVNLTALAVGREGEPVQMRWALCDAVGLPAADLDCPGQAGLDLPATSPVSAALVVSTPPPSGIPPDGVSLIIGFQATSAGQSLHGFAALPVRTSADPTPVRNPSVVALNADGVALPDDGAGTVRAGSTVQLTPIADEETVIFSFYSTAGDLDALRATAADPAVGWKAPDEAGPVQLWVVARDGRGGVGWLARTVQVVP